MTDLGEWMNNQHEQYIDSVAQGYPNDPCTPEYHSEGKAVGWDNPLILEEDELLKLKEEENDK